MSDALTSSGYGASMRRGSGSVFTFGVLPKERDDDVSGNLKEYCHEVLTRDFYVCTIFVHRFVILLVSTRDQEFSLVHTPIWICRHIACLRF